MAPDERSKEATAPESTGEETPADRVPNWEAVYTLEIAVNCPHCGKATSTLNAVRLLRNHVNFTSTLPRRGRVVVCPQCLSIVPAELTKL
jgi:ArsR family metal-binding transcriptional regulator